MAAAVAMRSESRRPVRIFGRDVVFIWLACSSQIVAEWEVLNAKRYAL
jgi:hypothetical protein